MSNAKILESKKAVVASIKEKLDRAQTVVLVDYRGLTVAEDTELRNQLRQAGVEYMVLKNTMIHLATKEMGFDQLADALAVLGESMGLSIRIQREEIFDAMHRI